MCLTGFQFFALRLEDGEVPTFGLLITVEDVNLTAAPGPGMIQWCRDPADSQKFLQTTELEQKWTESFGTF